jgi:erythromycin esterase-like protein
MLLYDRKNERAFMD